MRARLMPVLLLLALPVGGCMFRNASPTQKLTDQVRAFNDSARWGRIASASAQVQPGFRGDFIKTHRAWGRDIRLADGEVMSLQWAPDRASAEALVSYSWYDLRSMTAHTTVVRQTWEPAGDGYGLAEETVVDGNPQLFAAK